MDTSSTPVYSRLSRRTWGVLLFALGLIVCSTAQLAYRFNLPTDGWAVLSSEDTDQADWVYLENLAGAPSGLQRGDVIKAVNGLPVEGLASGQIYISPPPRWSAGHSVEMLIAREKRQLLLTAPIVHWSFPALWQRLIFQPEYLIGWFGGTVLFAVALFTFCQRPDIPATSALLVLSAAFLSINLSWLLPDGLSVQFNQLAAYAATFFGYLMFVVLLAPSLLVFTLLFPRPKQILQRHAWLGAIPFGIGAVTGAMTILEQASELGWMVTQAMVAGSLISLIHSGFTQRDAVSQAQLRWAGGGFVIGLTLMLPVYPASLGWVEHPWLAQLLGAGFQLGFTIIGGTLAVAVLRYNLFDIDLVINRALVYATLTASVIAIYMLVVGYLGWLFQTDGNLLLSLTATGIVAMIFAPLRNVVQRGVNRLLYGQRDEPYHVLTRLGQQLETAWEPVTALTVTVGAIAQALKLPYVAIALRQAGELQVVAAHGVIQNDVSRYPLLYAGEMVGELAVAGRAPNEALNPADQRLLRDLARQIGAVTQAALLAIRLEQARLRLVTERGEARRQLGADLHDSVGHQLVGLTRQVERASRTVSGDSVQTQQLLTEISRQLIALTQHVRKLAHQLFPPELAMLGLIGALRERAQTDAALRIQVDAPMPLPPLPAEIETALYYIALEALTNVEKHARASSCVILLKMVDHGAPPDRSSLELSICDNGIGVQAPGSGGLGLLSMQARAAEVGGTCHIEATPGQGTTVITRIPCARNSEV